MSSSTTKEPLLKVQGVSKAFPGVQALKQVDFELVEGELHFLIGENGAGKSTFINILSGDFPPDEGKIWLEGKEVRFNSPIEAQRAGVKTIHQEFMLIPNLNVAENITIGHRQKAFGPVMDWRRTYKVAEDTLKKLNVKLDLKKLVKNLTASEKQIVDIARALLGEAKILIMDEPTSALSSGEIEDLFKLIKELKRQGIAIIYISHRLEELSEIADRVTVFRDGNHICELPVTSELKTEYLVEQMVGAKIEDQYPHTPMKPGPVKIKTTNLSFDTSFRNINIEAKEGEIIGVTGVVGSGMEQLAYTLAGITGDYSGDIHVKNQVVKLKFPKDAIEEGIGFIPSDRRDMGIIVDFPVSHNISLPILEKLGKKGWIKKETEEAVAKDYASKLQIVTPGIYATTKNLSGGNQQKVVIAKWLAKAADTLVCVEPTRGIDVGAKTEIYSLFHQMVEEGKSVLLFSTDYSEVLGMCDRIYVIRDGVIVKEFKDNKVSREELIKAVFGDVEKSSPKVEETN